MGKLIRLELSNFKSYRGHHTLLFGDSYFTSIIGPNGSGKSNSMDAISFVLGIKSSHLRSAHLKDLVYRGRVLKTSKINDDGSAGAPNGHANGDSFAVDEESQSQKPARNDPKSAWVMAVYEDDAGDEQRWKRTIQTSGSSEYRINDRVVTAQQYNDALESENILIKARNFLVFQGDVEAIASQSPKDLTRLIEQISGSLEYKAEYERLQGEAEKAAEEQQYNLHRRRGINSEIKQYQEQKREAENYQNKSDERDHAIVVKILWKLYHFQRTMDESNTNIHEHKANLEECERGEAKYKKAFYEACQERDKVEANVKTSDKAVKRKEREIVDRENNELVPIAEKVKSINANIQDSRRKRTKIKGERDSITNEFERLKKELAKTEKAQAQFEVEWQQNLKQQGKKQLSAADFKDYKALKAKVATKTSANQAQLGTLLGDQRSKGFTLDNLKTQVGNLESQVQKLDSELTDITGRRDTAKELMRQLAQEVKIKKAKFKQVQHERVQSNLLRTELEGKYQSIMKEKEKADDGCRQNKRDAQARQTIVGLKSLFPGVKGRISELYQPKQKKYGLAIIAALGQDFEAVVVDTEKTSMECIQYLKDERKQRMKFIPLDNIKVDNVSSNLKSLSKARLTIDTIDFDSSLERAMSYACGNSIICDDLKIARNINHSMGIAVKAVTLDGTLIHKGGSMTGGRGSEDRMKQRNYADQDIDKLEAAAQKIIAEINALPDTIHKSTEESTLGNDLDALDRELSSTINEVAIFERNLKDKDNELSHVERDLTAMRPRYEQQVSARDGRSAKIKEFEEAIAKVQDAVFAEFCKRTGYSDVRVYEAQQGNLEHEVSEKRGEFETQKQKIQILLKSKETELGKHVGRITQMDSSIQSLEKELKGYEAEQQTYENEIEEMRGDLTGLEDQQHTLKEKLAAKTEKVTAARNEAQKRSKEIDNRKKEIANFEGELYRVKSKRRALLQQCKLNQTNVPLGEDSIPLDSLGHTDPDAMDVDNDDEQEATDDDGIVIDYDQLDEDYKERDDEDVETELEEKLQSLNNELEKLNPNMRAVDRLDSVEARLKSTEKDFDDSRKAAKAARDAFIAVKEKRFDLFNRAFTHISEQIGAVYKDLTRSASFPLGGQANLDIEDNDVPYLSGIKYHAMPPLKRFRDMEHLSGGEKTMAALALLFAVHSYQPSPFFVLDEVDAALDNANVEKIRNYVREHAGPGMQFIVISLKTGLFQGSESLVGVYRDQEANSSKTLTLDLRKYV